MKRLTLLLFVFAIACGDVPTPEAERRAYDMNFDAVDNPPEEHVCGTREAETTLVGHWEAVGDDVEWVTDCNLNVDNYYECPDVACNEVLQNVPPQ